jgi:hypothetical protein
MRTDPLAMPVGGALDRAAGSREMLITVVPPARHLGVYSPDFLILTTC